jgi:drug/metabolite transporter (DMT)-like permease
LFLKRDLTAREPKLGSLAAIHAAVLLFGISGLFGKFLTVSPLVIVFGRTVFAALALAPILLKSGITPFRADRHRLVIYMFQGALLALHWCTFFLSIQISTVALGLLTFSSFPLFVTLLEPLFFKERLRPFDMVIALLVFAGLVLVLPSFDFSQKPVQGALWGTFSGFTFALLAIFNKKNLAFDSPMGVAFHQNAFAALSLVPILLVVPPGIPTPKEILLLAGLGTICTALSHTLFISSLKQLRATTVSIITALEPLYGILLAALLLNEMPTIRTLAGGAIILTATTLATRSHKKKR